jgi:AraC family transcriptional activator of pobA
MDGARNFWHFSDMIRPTARLPGVPAWNLYGEAQAFPDVLHIERITDRAAGLDWVIAPHRHQHLHQFFLIREGHARILADGREFRPAAPILLSIPPGVVHGFTFSAQTDGYVLSVPLQTLPDILAQTALHTAGLAQVALLPADRLLEEHFHRLHAEHGASLPARPVMLRALAAEIACIVLRALPEPQDQQSTRGDPRFVKFQALVQAHLRNRWQVTDFARAVGVSERHLGRLCVAATGQSPAAVIEAARMREAARLLAYTRAGVASVGHQLGFDDPSYFSRAFRRATGISPRAYKAGFETG